MFVALWEYEVKPGCEKGSRRLMAQTVTGYGCSGTTPATVRRGW